MAKRKILWLDDDLMFYSSFSDELEEFYRIDFVKSPEELWRSLDDAGVDKYSGIILDVLLPFGTMDIEKTNGGLRTGLAVLEFLKASVYKRIPVVIFTIRENGDVDDIGKKYNAMVMRKSEVRISEFVETIIKEFGE